MATKTKTAPTKVTAKAKTTEAKAAAPKVEETKSTLSSPRIATKLKGLHSKIEKHDQAAKINRAERDQIILDEIGNGAPVTVVAEAAGVTRQHIYKNILEKNRAKA